MPSQPPEARPDTFARFPEPLHLDSDGAYALLECLEAYAQSLMAMSRGHERDVSFSEQDRSWLQNTLPRGIEQMQTLFMAGQDEMAMKRLKDAVKQFRALIDAHEPLNVAESAELDVLKKRLSQQADAVRVLYCALLRTIGQGRPAQEYTEERDMRARQEELIKDRRKKTKPHAPRAAS